MKKRKALYSFVGTGILLAAVIGFCILLQNSRAYSQFVSTIASLSEPERPPKFETWETIVQDYRIGRLTDIYGIIEISEQTEPGTVDNLVFETHNHGGKLFLFPTWQGKGSNLRGYIYSEMDLSPQPIEILCPDPGTPAGTRKTGVEIEKTDRLHWYKAARSLD